MQVFIAVSEWSPQNGDWLDIDYIIDNDDFIEQAYEIVETEHFYVADTDDVPDVFYKNGSIHPQFFEFKTLVEEKGRMNEIEEIAELINASGNSWWDYVNSNTDLEELIDACQFQEFGSWSEMASWYLEEIQGIPSEYADRIWIDLCQNNVKVELNQSFGWAFTGLRGECFIR